jgi:hypothetical protein
MSVAARIYICGGLALSPHQSMLSLSGLYKQSHIGVQRLEAIGLLLLKSQQWKPEAN